MKRSKALQYNLLYNGEIKKEFIEQYTSIDSKLTLYWQFLKIEKWERGWIDKETGEEKGFKKDLSEMSNEEIEIILKDIKCSTITSAINHINTYKRYIDWFRNRNFNGSTNVNPFSKYESLSELASEVVANERNMRYSREELMFMLDELENYTDQALLLAIFEGIKGKSFSELLTLKKDNLFVEEGEVHDKYFAKLYDEGSRDYRTIEISQDLYKILILADKQQYYTSAQEELLTEFNASEFIFKKGRKGKQGDIILDRHFITRKFVFFKKFFGNKYLTADDIAQSGMMHMAYELYNKNKKIGKPELLKIGEQYNTIMASTAQTESYRNITVLKRIIFTEQLGEIYSELKGVTYADQ